jgi:hypothetical protein
LVVLGIFIASSVKKETNIFQKVVNLLLKVPVTYPSLGFDPHTINEGLAGYTVEQIQKIVRYHWDESENSFWRDKTNTRDFFARNLPKMADAIPSYWLNPKRIGKKSFFHPKPGLNRNA